MILRALHCRISVSAITGEFKRAAQDVDEGLAVARRLGAPGWIIRFELTAARFANATGDEEQALRLSLSALATAKRGGDTRAILEAAVLLQLWIPGSQAASAALPSPAELIAMAGAIRQTAIQTVLLPSFALQVLAAGDSAGAADWCAQGLELSGDDPSSIPAGYSLLAAAQIAAHAGDLELAASIHGRLREAQVQLYAALDQAHIAAYEAAIDRVRGELGMDAFDAAATTGARLDWISAITKVKGYLRQVSVRQGSQPPQALVTPVLAPAQPLTRRQLEVLRLLASGFTNKEIAGRLGMTPKTVMHHTVAIYQRLGVRGRGEAVAWAFRAGVAPQTS